ncbi:MAG: OmpA family protein [Balneolaceae bacterium]
MKNTFTILLLLIFIAGLSQLQAQDSSAPDASQSEEVNRWSFDAYIGNSITRNDRASGIFFGSSGVNSDFLNPAIGAGLRYSFSPYVNTQLNIGYSSLSDGDNPGDLTYNSSLLTTNLRANVNLLRLFEIDSFSDNINIYSFWGFGMSHFSVSDITGADDMEFPQFAMMHNVGAGSKFKIGSSTDLFVEYDLQRFFTPRIDGYPDLSPRNGGSNYSMIKVGLTFRLGSPERKHMDWISYDRTAVQSELTSLQRAQEESERRISEQERLIASVNERLDRVEDQHSERMDSFESRIQELEEKMESGVMIEQATLISGLQPVHFDYDSDQLTSAARQLLSQNVDRILQLPDGATVRVDAFTDHVGGDPYNMRLSLRRANSVAGFYIENGVESNRVQRRGLGKAPVQCSDNEQDSNTPGCIQNRRVETHIIMPQN